MTNVLKIPWIPGSQEQIMDTTSEIPSVPKQTPILPPTALAEFCDRWRISALELFGSALRGDFRPDSDLDFLVTFRTDANWSLFDHVRMKQELETLTGRKADLITRRALERSHNWLLRQEILGSARVVYSEDEPSDVAG